MFPHNLYNVTHLYYVVFGYTLITQYNFVIHFMAIIYNLESCTFTLVFKFSRYIKFTQSDGHLILVNL